MTDEHYHPDDSSDRRGRAEESIRADEARPRETLSDQQLKRLVHELQAHQVAVEMQNDELQRAQAAAQAASERYCDLFDFAPVAVFPVGPRGADSGGQPGRAVLLGLDRKARIEKRFGQFVAMDCRTRVCRLLQTDVN